jgi:hypothetical protein
MIGGAPLSSRWYAPTWSVAGGVLLNTPTLGGELLVDGVMEIWTDASNLTNWTKTIAGTSSLNRESAIVSGGTYAARLDCDGSGSSAQIYVAGIVPTFARVSVMARNSSGSYGITVRNSGSTATAIAPSLNQTYAEKFVSARYINGNFVLGRLEAAAYSLYLDSASVRQIASNSVFATINARQSNVNVVAPVIQQYAASTNAGVVLRLDSGINPQNFVLAYLHPNYSTNVIIEKCVNGTYTTLSTVVAAYGATKYFSAKMNGSSISIYYGTTDFGTLIATVTVSDASVVNNTRHGLFSTYSGNQFAGTFSVVPYA